MPTDRSGGTPHSHVISGRRRPPHDRVMDIAIVVFPQLTALDALGPYQVLTRLPGAEVSFVADQAGEVRDDIGLVAFPVERTFAAAGRPDVLVVPGGTIT